MRSLLLLNRAHFSKDVFLSGSNPIKDRVMSTPTWPVPYYQRLTKAYPIRGTFRTIQRRGNPISEESTSLLTIPLGSPLKSILIKPRREDRSSPTPNSTSKPSVPLRSFSLSNQERRLRDHDKGLRERYLTISGHYQQGKCQDSQRKNVDLIAMISPKRFRPKYYPLSQSLHRFYTFYNLSFFLNYHNKITHKPESPLSQLIISPTGNDINGFYFL
jgi:hypothetical protein